MQDAAKAFRETSMRQLGALLLLFIASAAHAAGVQRASIPAQRGDPKIDLLLWTPCSSPPGDLKFGGPLRLKGVLDCPIQSERLPLVIISHGLGGAFLSHHDTAETLADNGFIVIALNHPLDSGAGDMKKADDIASMIARPGDVKRVIDYALSNSPLRTKIDAHRIGFFGFSRGGYTGLMLAGAIPDYQRFLQGCPDTVKLCGQVHRKEVPNAPPAFDPRIRAYVIADPVNTFAEKGLQKITAPVQLWSSALGGQGVVPKETATIAKELGPKVEYHAVPNSTHLSFLLPCTPAIEKVTPKDVCADPVGFDRPAFHKTFDAAVLGFLRKNLGD
jgi:predicted dienelactone hydrolase